MKTLKYPLEQHCANCGHSYGTHRVTNDNCPHLEPDGRYTFIQDSCFKPVSSTRSLEDSAKSSTGE